MIERVNWFSRALCSVGGGAWLCNQFWNRRSLCCPIISMRQLAKRKRASKMSQSATETSPATRDNQPRKTFQRSEEHTSELQSPDHLVCRLLLEKKKKETSSRRYSTQPKHLTPPRPAS